MHHFMYVYRLLSLKYCFNRPLELTGSDTMLEIFNWRFDLIFSMFLFGRVLWVSEPNTQVYWVFIYKACRIDNLTLNTFMWSSSIFIFNVGLSTYFSSCIFISKKPFHQFSKERIQLSLLIFIKLIKQLSYISKLLVVVFYVISCPLYNYTTQVWVQ